MRYRILYTITPLAEKDDPTGFPEGMPLTHSEIQHVSKRSFATPDLAEDFLRHNKYSQGTGFFAKESTGKIDRRPSRAYISAIILPEL